MGELWWGLSVISNAGAGKLGFSGGAVTINEVLTFSALTGQEEAAGPQGTKVKGVPIASHHLGHPSLV